MGKNKTPKFYAVHTGRNGFRGIVNDWPSCERLVSGVPGAVFKSFCTRAEAATFAEVGRGEGSGAASRPPAASSRANFRPLPRQSAVVRGGTLPARASLGSADYTNASSSVRTAGANSEPLDRPSGAGILGGSEHPSASSVAVVYTDGACTNNGKTNANAGVGVYFGPGDSLNLSEPLSGPVQTNQRAEQTGVLRAMQLALSGRRVSEGDTLLIRTDSTYTVKGLTVWMKNWKKNGWKASTGGTVKNDDLWRALDEAKVALSAAGVRLQLEWIKGHAGHTGNEAADRLAVNGIASP